MSTKTIKKISRKKDRGDLTFCIENQQNENDRDKQTDRQAETDFINLQKLLFMKAE